jgi:hypothetical protein
MSAGETDISRYHYAGGKFVPVKGNPDKCETDGDKQGACAAIDSAIGLARTITPAEYDGLWQGFEKAEKPGPSRQEFNAKTHAIDFPLVGDRIAIAVGSGDCKPPSNCTISIYGCKASYVEGNIPQCEYWPMLRGVSGWGVTRARDWESDPFSMRAGFVIARSISATEVELSRYSVRLTDIGPKAGTQLTRDACKMVSVKSGKLPGQWNAAEFVAQGRACE